MKISKQIIKIQKLAVPLFDDEDVPDFLMVDIDCNIVPLKNKRNRRKKSERWQVTLSSEYLGDGHPWYLDTNVKGDSLVISAVGPTLVAALRNLEKCVIANLEALDERVHR